MLNVELTPAGAIPDSSILACDRSGSYHTFSDHLREFIASRLDQVDPYAESAEYRRQQEIVSHLHDRLLEPIPLLPFAPFVLFVSFVVKHSSNQATS